MFFVAAVKVQQKQSDVNRNLQVHVSIKNKSLYFFFFHRDNYSQKRNLLLREDSRTVFNITLKLRYQIKQ